MNFHLRSLLQGFEDSGKLYFEGWSATKCIVAIVRRNGVYREARGRGTLYPDRETSRIGARGVTYWDSNPALQNTPQKYPGDRSVHYVCRSRRGGRNEKAKLDKTVLYLLAPTTRLEASYRDVMSNTYVCLGIALLCFSHPNVMAFV